MLTAATCHCVDSKRPVDAPLFCATRAPRTCPMILDEALERNAELGAQVQHFEDELKLAPWAIEKLQLEVT